MAITQISRIQQRSGLQVDLPRLATAEFGWSTDSRRLFIGNGSISEGAPVVGNTEVLTEFSDIIGLDDSYTYQGAAAGYTAQTGPTIDSPVTMSLQTWMDQWVTVKDFGATGDGLTDDTDAINRALYQVYGRSNNPQTRKALYFPAGVYRVTSTILVPPYATLYGEGAENSIIVLSGNSVSQFVIRTTDSDQHYGDQIGSNSATLPTNVTVMNMAITTTDPESNLVLLEDVNDVRFESVTLIGPLMTTEIENPNPNTAAIRFRSKPIKITNNVVFDKCKFSNVTWAINSNDYETNELVTVKAVTVTESKFTELYQGVLLGQSTGDVAPVTGFRIVNNVFDSIYAQAIWFGRVILNLSAYNTFYNCGSYLLGDTKPYTAIVQFLNGDNISWGDMFARPDENSTFMVPGTSYPRILLNCKPSIATNNGSQINVGTYVRQSGNTADLGSDVPFPTAIFDGSGNLIEVNSVLCPVFAIDYQIIRGSIYRTGTISVTSIGSAPTPVWSDDYTENLSSGIVFSVEQVGENATLLYTAYNLGVSAQMSFSIRTFDYVTP